MKMKFAAAMIALCIALVPAVPAWAKNSGEKTKGLLPKSVEVTQAAADEGTVDEGEVPHGCLRMKRRLSVNMST